MFGQDPTYPEIVPALRADAGLTLSRQSQSLPVGHVERSAGSAQGNAQRTLLTAVMFIWLGVNEHY